MMLLYYITDRKQFTGTEADQRNALLKRMAEASRAGVDYIQLREKDLSCGTLERLAVEALRVVRDNSEKTRLLINSRLDVALAAGADGVHLTSTDISASEARAIRMQSAANLARPFLFAVSCHSAEEVRSAEAHGADFTVLAPVFEKQGTDLRAIGTSELARATQKGVPPDLRVEAGDHRVRIPVLALGGVTVRNAGECIEAGARGIAAIRLFQAGDVSTVVHSLRQLDPA